MSSNSWQMVRSAFLRKLGGDKTFGIFGGLEKTKHWECWQSVHTVNTNPLATIKTDRKWFCVSSRWQQSSSKATVLLLLLASSPAWPAAVAEEEGGRAAAAAVLAFYPKQQQHGHKGNKYYASRILGNIFAMNWNADTSLQTYISNSLRKGFNSRVIGFNFTDIIVPSCSTTSSYSNDFAFLCIHYIYMFV